MDERCEMLTALLKESSDCSSDMIVSDLCEIRKAISFDRCLTQEEIAVLENHFMKED
ncbi:hypothetical protein LCGC14_0432600 [marine sediment metagenome]|uniref:Uncharacterized protein n=1 Tax=marine sediment metagenome TaxID=412755 RepID=A0A0F9V9H6_9ZZZZ